ncbi:uncharacterized protein LOC126894464 isoform X2 [Daktulosphaira vitifoliae]|uniref:uncharacterized protein LOC126894464 isoform X2 n=1 Tax=Daktulosphaira vitifoliae TaxID=58002 RepID=UPI0021A97A4E|nr:uncharacterized protein LOC126894464 isoform X2 [Daktulosphaira vitifoliae]
MVKKYFLLMSIIFWYLSEVLTQTSLQEINKEHFKSYLISSLDHICKQSGWKTMEHLQFQQFSCTINTSCITKDSANENNYLEKISCLTHLLNCEYTVVMEKFNVMLGVILDKCQEEKYNNRIDQLGHCLNRIHGIFKSSITTFSKMLDAARYINQIDLRIINSSLINPKCIEYEIELFYNNATKIVQQYSDYSITQKKYYIFDLFEQINELYNETENTILYLYETRKVCGPDHKNTISTDLVTVLNIDQINKSVNNLYDYVDIIYNEVSSYMAKVIENNFLNLGFEKIIGTNSFKFTYYTYTKYVKSVGLQLYEILLSHKGWKLWKHINVKNKFSKWNQINIDQLNVPINGINYSYIRTCTIEFLKCRCIEIFQYFISMLECINKVCQDENKNSCATTLFDIMVKSDEMFKNMLFALMTLRYTKVSNEKRNTATNIELQIEFCRNFIYNMRRKYWSSSSFIGQITYSEPKEFLEDIKMFTKDLSTKFFHTSQYQMKYCVIEKDSDLYDLMIKFYNLININFFNEYTDIHKTMYVIFNNFIEKINKETYENLGFNKIKII